MSDLAGQRVLVTGASGFIGARLCRAAVGRGALVYAVSRRAMAPAASAQLRWERADLTDAAAVRAVVARVRPDVVLHLASEVAGTRERDAVLPMLHANLLAAVNVMVAADEAGCGRVVLAGSVEEPDLGDPDALAQSPYAAAKWGAQAYGRMFHALYALPVVHLRLFMVYGPGQRDVRKLVPYVTCSLLRGEAPLLSSGERAVDWIYVDDVVDAFLAAATAPGVEGSSLDVGTGTLVSVRALAARLADLVGGDAEPVFGAIPDRPRERVRVADTQAAAAAIGWLPRVALDEGLARTVAFYRETVAREAPARA